MQNNSIQMTHVSGFLHHCCSHQDLVPLYPNWWQLQLGQGRAMPWNANGTFFSFSHRYKFPVRIFWAQSSPLYRKQIKKKDSLAHTLHTLISAASFAMCICWHRVPLRHPLRRRHFMLGEHSMQVSLCPYSHIKTGKIPNRHVAVSFE